MVVREGFLEWSVVYRCKTYDPITSEVQVVILIFKSRDNCTEVGTTENFKGELFKSHTLVRNFFPHFFILNSKKNRNTVDHCG